MTLGEACAVMFHGVRRASGDDARLPDAAELLLEATRPRRKSL